MKTKSYLIIFILGIFLLSSCKKYLDRTPAADISDKDVFGTYESFQGFVDPNYQELINYNSHYLSSTMDIGGEVTDYTSWSSGNVGNLGDYWMIAGSSGSGDGTSLFNNPGLGYGVLVNDGSGIWRGGWRGIRRCNVALQNMKLLSEATPEQDSLLLGQLYFFRAYFHQNIIEAYGGMPYIDTVLAAAAENHLPRLSYFESVEKIVTDYDRAIALLPKSWDSTITGGQHLNANAGRAVKGTALAYKAKLLLYASSPLMNKFSGNDYTYNVDYAKRAADAGWAMIKLANEGYYSLVPFTKYSDNFYKVDGTIPYTTETIWQRMKRQSGSGQFSDFIARDYCFPRMGGSYCESVNQTFIDKFEMLDGTRYKVEYDQDNAKRWDFRDPRFRKNIIVDRDQWGLSTKAIIYLYSGEGTPATDKIVSQKVALPYLIKKFWPIAVNGYDRQWSNFRYVSPLMRLAEVYLDYAEAVTAAYGPSGSAPGSNFTAVDAINVVRFRAGMPLVTATSYIAAGYPSFMDLVWNERTVELCFEGHYWYDIRRWHVGHLPENIPVIDLLFDKAWTPSSFVRTVFRTRTFEDPKHYWLPLPRNLVQQYKEMFQNPGWQ